MKKKMILAAALIAFVAFSASAEMGMYFKGIYGRGFRVGDWGEVTQTASAAGYGSSSVTYDVGSMYSNFERMITPSFGITPWASSDNAFLSGLSFEFGLEFAMGSLSGIDSRTFTSSGDTFTFPTDYVFGITPSAMAVYGHQFGKVVPYVGLGFSVPILINWQLTGDTYNGSTTDYYGTITFKTDVASFGFNVNIMGGVGYAVSENFMPVFELGYGFGTSQSFSARIGAVFTIKDGGRGGNGGNPPPPPPPPAEEAAEE